MLVGQHPPRFLARSSQTALLYGEPSPSFVNFYFGGKRFLAILDVTTARANIEASKKLRFWDFPFSYAFLSFFVVDVSVLSPAFCCPLLPDRFPQRRRHALAARIGTRSGDLLYQWHPGFSAWLLSLACSLDTPTVAPSASPSAASSCYVSYPALIVSPRSIRPRPGAQACLCESAKLEAASSVHSAKRSVSTQRSLALAAPDGRFLVGCLTSLGPRGPPPPATPSKGNWHALKRLLARYASCLEIKPSSAVTSPWVSQSAFPH